MAGLLKNLLSKIAGKPDQEPLTPEPKPAPKKTQKNKPKAKKIKTNPTPKNKPKTDITPTTTAPKPTTQKPATTPIPTARLLEYINQAADRNILFLLSTSSNNIQAIHKADPESLDTPLHTTIFKLIKAATLSNEASKKEKLEKLDRYHAYHNIVEILIFAGADPKAKNDENKTPQDYLKEYNNPELTKWFNRIIKDPKRVATQNQF